MSVPALYPPGMPDRSFQLKVLLSRDEKRWLKQIADQKGLTVSDVLRQYIRIERDKLGRTNGIYEKRRVAP